MTEEEKILTGDKLIACFMGYDFHNGLFIHRKAKTPIGNTFYPKECRYYSSWDWIIPVKRKAIETGHCIIVMNNYDVSLTTFSRPHENDGFCKLYFHTSPNGNNRTEIQALWNALVEFIEWHNQNI